MIKRSIDGSIIKREQTSYLGPFMKAPSQLGPPVRFLIDFLFRPLINKPDGA